ncbi:MAG: hypothetical protein ACYCU5_16420, partial [Actinomycetes bacterium]
APTPSPAEVAAALFPSDQGGVGYLFGHGMLDAVPTPLEQVPANRPNAAALAMNASGEGMTVHVSGAPDVPSPVGPVGAQGQEAGVPGEPTVATPQAVPVSTLRQTLTNEWGRVRGILVGLGGKVSGG